MSKASEAAEGAKAHASDTPAPAPVRDNKADVLAFASPQQLQNAYHAVVMKVLSECTLEELENAAKKQGIKSFP